MATTTNEDLFKSLFILLATAIWTLDDGATVQVMAVGSVWGHQMLALQGIKGRIRATEVDVLPGSWKHIKKGGA